MMLNYVVAHADAFILLGLTVTASLLLWETL